MKAHLVIALGLALGLAIVVLLVAPAPASEAAIVCQRYVAVAGNNSGDCSDEGKPCQAVQYAIDQSAKGDRICVSSDMWSLAPTVYYEHITIDHPVILDGKWESECPVGAACSFYPMGRCKADRIELDGFGQGRVITILPDTDPTIDCFTITGGDANGLGGDPEHTPNHAGGGIYGSYASPTIINNIILSNYGCNPCSGAYGRGGGIYLLKAGDETLLSGNVVAGNVADESSWGQGGGIMLRDSGGTIEGNLITENRAGHSAGYGGGIAIVGGTPLITGNEVWDNVAGQATQGLGGGIFVWSDSTTTIDDNAVYDNRALIGAGDPLLRTRGGGICYVGDPEVLAIITNNKIYDNVASPVSTKGFGGGLYASGLITPSVIAGNLFEWNIAGYTDSGDGGGIYLEESEAIVEGNTLEENIASWEGGMGQGGGLYVQNSTVTIRGSEVMSNTCGYFGAPATTIGYGGGMVISNTLALVEGNEITGNRATNAPEEGFGGGIYAYTSTVRIVDNTIAENTLTAGNLGVGAGLYLHYSLPVVDGNTIIDNMADGTTHGRGGGLSLGSCSPFTVTNNIVARNSATQWASGVAVAESTGWMAHNTIADNTGGDGAGVRVYAVGHLTAYGNIIHGHEWGIYCEDSPGLPPSTATAEYTLFEANTDDYTPNVISTNEILPPAMLLTDYHIPVGSSAIDQVPASVWVTRDIDGEPRPAGAAADAGADERQLMVYLPLILRNY